MGHGSCGGCAAALTRQFEHAQTGSGRFIGNWVKMLDEARDAVTKEHSALDEKAFLEMELRAVQVSMKNLRTFPWIAERETAAKLALHGCHFSINDGKLYVLDEAEGVFRPA